MSNTNPFEWISTDTQIIDDLIDFDPSPSLDSDQDPSEELFSQIDEDILHERNTAAPNPDTQVNISSK